MVILLPETDPSTPLQCGHLKDEADFKRPVEDRLSVTVYCLHWTVCCWSLHRTYSGMFALKGSENKRKDKRNWSGKNKAQAGAWAKIKSSQKWCRSKRELLPQDRFFPFPSSKHFIWQNTGDKTSGLHSTPFNPSQTSRHKTLAPEFSSTVIRRNRIVHFTRHSHRD